MKKIAFISIVLLCVIRLQGQTHIIDSLKNKAIAAGNGRQKLAALIRLLDEEESLPTDTAWKYSSQALALAVQYKDTMSATRAVITQSNVYLAWRNVDSAKALIEKELPKYRVENTRTRDLYFRLHLLNAGYMTYSYDKYKDASALIYTLMAEAKRYDDSDAIARCMSKLATYQYNLGFMRNAIGWEQKALAYTSGAAKFARSRIAIFLSLGDAYYALNQPDSAYYFYMQSARLSEKAENLSWYAIGLSRIAQVYAAKSNYPAAERYALKSLEMIKKVDGDAFQYNKLRVLANIYFDWKKNDEAIKVLTDGLIQDSLYKERHIHKRLQDAPPSQQMISYYELLAQCYLAEKDYKNYAATLQKIISGKDTLYKKNSAAALAELQTRYDVQSKEVTIARQRLAIVQKNDWIYGSFAFIILLSAIASLIFYNYRHKQKFRSEKAVIEAQESERRRIAADLHDNLGAKLSHIKRNATFIMDNPQTLTEDDKKKYLSGIDMIAKDAIIDLRETIWVLSAATITMQGFADKLKSYLGQQLADWQHIRCDFRESIAENYMLTLQEAMHIFRIVQELVHNIIQHSDADTINVSLAAATSNLELIVQDNGKGFDTTQKKQDHYGLDNIKERAKNIGATFNIESCEGKGTKALLCR